MLSKPFSLQYIAAWSKVWNAVLDFSVMFEWSIHRKDKKNTQSAIYKHTSSTSPSVGLHNSLS